MSPGTVEITVGWDIFLGVFGGTLAGVVTTAAVHHFNLWLGKKKRLKNARFEVNMIIKRIEKWLSDIEKLKTSIISKTLDSSPFYFDFSRVGYPTIGAMFSSGELYDYLMDEQICSLQEAASRLTTFWENNINSDFTNMKSMEISEAINRAKFWEHLLSTHRNDLLVVLERLKR